MEKNSTSENTSEISRKAADLISSTIDLLHPDKRQQLPSIFKMHGRWVVVNTNNVLALFYFTPEQFRKAVERHKTHGSSIIGLFSLDQTQIPTAIKVSGTNNIFASNKVVNMYSFSISPGGSFIIIDHIQSGKDENGQLFEYKIDLALVLGLRENETWDAIATRLLQLFDSLLWLKDAS